MTPGTPVPIKRTEVGWRVPGKGAGTGPTRSRGSRAERTTKVFETRIHRGPDGSRHGPGSRLSPLPGQDESTSSSKDDPEQFTRIIPRKSPGVIPRDRGSKIVKPLKKGR